MPIYIKSVFQGGKKNEKNIPAQEASQKEGSRFQKPYGNSKRKKGSCKTPCKGQKAAHLLIEAIADAITT